MGWADWRRRAAWLVARVLVVEYATLLAPCAAGHCAQRDRMLMMLGAQRLTTMADRVAGVCFDLDGVLIRTMPLHATAWLDVASRWNLPVSRREIYRWEGEPGTVTARRLLGRLPVYPARARWRGTGKQGRLILANTATTLLREKEACFTTLARGIRVHAPWVALLKTLHQRRIALALVTGTSRAEVQRIVPRAILDRFDVIVTGDSVRHGKPHPEPYRTACRRLRIPPSRAVVIENAPYGIQSARRARIGCIVALTSSLPAAYLQGADVIVHSGRQLRVALKQLFADPGFSR